MISTISIIGFGKAGGTFAEAGGWRERAHAYDVKSRTHGHRSAKYLDYATAGVTGCSNVEAALCSSQIVISVATADQALEAAAAAAVGALVFTAPQAALPDHLLQLKRSIKL